MRHYKILRRPEHLALAFLLLISCQQNSMEDVRSLTNIDEGPVLLINEARIIYTDSARLKAKLDAGVVEKYMEEEDQREIYKEGVYVEFYDPKGNLSSTLSAQKATRFLEKDLTEIEDDVVVVNADGDSLSTEFLVWNNAENRIYSEKKVRVRTSDEIIHSDGFESNVSFTNYRFKNITGTITLDEDE